MGTTRIKVVDLSQEVEQIKTSRKRAQSAGIKDIKKPLVKEKKREFVGEKPEEEVKKAESHEKPEEKEKPLTREKVRVSKQKYTQKLGRKYQNAKLFLDSNKFYPLDNAIELSKKVSISKFAGSVETHIVVNRKNIRGMVNFPHQFKKPKKILVFTSDKLNLKNGVSLANETTIKEIADKKLVPKKDFDLVISEPSFMPKLAALGKILGPAGLMPNPKTGTVTQKPEEAVKKFGEGVTEFKSEPNGFVIHTTIGKTSQPDAELKENLLALVKVINPQRIEKLYLAPTMGPSVKVDVSTLHSINPKNK